MSAGDMTRIRRLERVTKTVPLINPFTYTSGLPNNNTTSTFVLACIDPRFAYALEKYLDEIYAQNGLSYDLFILAGAAMGGNLTGNSATPPPANTVPNCAIVSTGNNWQTTLYDHIQVAIALHNVTEIVIIDHLNCGAYTACKAAGTDTDYLVHKAQYDTLVAAIGARSFTTNAGGTAIGSAIFTFAGKYFDGIAASSTSTLRNVSTGATLIPPIVEPKGTNSGAKVLVLGCIDPRYSAVMTSFLTNYVGVQFLYDLFITAGASIGVNQSYTTGLTRRTNGTRGAYPNNILADGAASIGNLGYNWGPTFFDHLSVARLLHNITEVWVFDHLDCGAYKGILSGSLTATDDAVGPHTTEILKLQSLVNLFTAADPLNSSYTVSFKGFVIDKSGTIQNVVNDNTGLRLDTTVGFGSSNVRNQASTYTDLIAYSTADYLTNSQPLDVADDQLAGTALSLTNRTKICGCATEIHRPRVGILRSAVYQHSRIV